MGIAPMQGKSASRLAALQWLGDCWQLWNLAWPVILSRLGVVTLGLIDIAVLGQYSTHSVAVMTIAWVPTGIFLVSGIGLMQGVQALSARAFGEGRPERAGLAWRRGIFIATFAGILCAGLLLDTRPIFAMAGQSPDLSLDASLVTRLLGLTIWPHLLFVACAFYLESRHKPFIPLIFMLITNGLNLVLAIWFVFGGAGVPALGAAGAALATVLARYFLGFGLVIFIWRMKGAEGVRGGVADDGRLGLIWRMGISAALALFFEVAAFNGMAIIAGWSGELAVASFGMYLNIMSLLFMTALGMAVATGVLVGEGYGANDPIRMRRALLAGASMTILITLSGGLLVFLLAHPIASALTDDPILLAALVPILGLMVFAIIPDGLQTVASFSLRARGDVILPTVSHLLAYVGIMLPVGVYLSHYLGHGARGVVEAIIVGSFASGLILSLRCVFLFGRDRRRAKPSTSNP